MQFNHIIASVLIAFVGVQAAPQPELVERQTTVTATIQRFPTTGGCVPTNPNVNQTITAAPNTCVNIPNTVSVKTLSVSPGCLVIYLRGQGCPGNFGDEPNVGICTQASTPYGSLQIKCPPS